MTDPQRDDDVHNLAVLIHSYLQQVETGLRANVRGNVMDEAGAAWFRVHSVGTGDYIVSVRRPASYRCGYAYMNLLEGGLTRICSLPLGHSGDHR